MYERNLVMHMQIPCAYIITFGAWMGSGGNSLSLVFLYKSVGALGDTRVGISAFSKNLK